MLPWYFEVDLQYIETDPYTLYKKLWIYLNASISKEFYVLF